MAREKSSGFRLPQNVRPKKYDITLEPDFNTFTFRGYADIALTVQEPSHAITVNAAKLDIHMAFISQRRNIELIKNIVLDDEKETVTFEFNAPLAPGKSNISIHFKGTLGDELVGFYRSKYALPNGDERYMATTQFEAIDARRAFPCFDEPSFKATFDLTLVVPKDRAAISNMLAVDEIALGPDKKAIRFEETPVMSTYLLAFVVGDLEYVEAKTKKGTLVRVFATPGKKDQCAFALDVAIKALGYFEDYFGIPYPLPKLDLAAIPDFDAGAMENWGLVTFREIALLVDPARSSSAAKQRVAFIIAHELAHQWFGNLVTMEWWNDLWLNESFASFMGEKAVNRLFPDWKVWDLFYTRDTARGLSLDALKTSHPIEADIKNPKDIGQIFDAISYSKGAALLRMLEDFLGEETFRRGVMQYLLRHQYGNAKTQDLWDALAEESGRAVREIMSNWTSKTGYPVISAERSSYESACALELSQRRFFYIQKGRKDKSLWKVPVSISAAGEAMPARTLLESSTKKILMSAPRDVPWIKLNFGQNGFFRVKYSPGMLADLCSPIQDLSLPTIDRAGIASDVWALSKACLIPATQFLDICAHYRNETEYPVWAELASGLSEIAALLDQEPWSRDLKKFVRNLFAPIGKSMGWDAKPNEGELAPLLRSIALGQLGYSLDQETIEEARQRFALLRLNQKALTPDLRRVVCNIAAMYGRASTYEALSHLYRSATLKEEQLCYAQAMGNFEDKKLLAKTLAFALSSEVRHENTAFVVTSVATNPHGTELAWKFLKDNWEELRARYAHSIFMLGRIIGAIVSGFCTEAAKKDVRDFFSNHPVPEADMALRQSLERVDMNIAWLARNKDEVAQWLKERKGAI